MLIQEILSLIIGYLLGSIPTTYIAGCLKRGEDIRKLGGGNMGALNATRELGLKVGAIVLVVDIAKGAGAILIAKALGLPQIWVFAAGFAAIAGHCWPVWLKFKGGKGAATTIGIFIALAPPALACSLPIMVVVILFTSNTTLGMAAGFVFYPLFLWIFSHPASEMIYAGLIILFLAARYAPTFIMNLKKAGNAHDFIIEQNFKPWQTKRK